MSSCPNRCPTCPEKTNPAPPPQPTGPQPARVLLVGEGPAEEELKRGRVFAGKTGEELDGQYCAIAGVDRDAIRVTNASLCPGRKKGGGIDNPTVEQAAACAAWHLPGELMETQPDIVVLMGAVAIEAVLGRKVDLEMQNGIPVQNVGSALWMYYAGAKLPLVVPTYHPSAGLHDGAWMNALQDAFRRLRKLVRGDYSDVVVDAFPHPELIEVGAAEFIHLPELYEPLAMDTENIYGRPWCMTLAYRPDAAYFIDAANRTTLGYVGRARRRGQWVLHNAIADIPMAALMDVEVEAGRFIDTMERAHYAQEFRKGLKPLAYRYLGMQMKDYDDVTKPHTKAVLFDWAQVVVERMVAAVPDKRGAKTLTDDEAAVRKHKTLLKRLLTDMQKGYDNIDPWKRTETWAEKGYDVELMNAFGDGPLPMPSLEYVPREEAVPYACKDAIATLRLVPVLMDKVRLIRERGKVAA